MVMTSRANHVTILDIMDITADMDITDMVLQAALAMTGMGHPHRHLASVRSEIILVKISMGRNTRLHWPHLMVSVKFPKQVYLQYFCQLSDGDLYNPTEQQPSSPIDTSSPSVPISTSTTTSTSTSTSTSSTTSTTTEDPTLDIDLRFGTA